MKHEGALAQPENEQLAHLVVREIRGLRGELQQLSARLTRIEKRVVHIYPALAASRTKRTSGVEATTTKVSPEDALKLYDELVECAKGGKDDEAMARLEALADDDLKVMATELGAPVPRSPSRAKLMEAIVGRIRQSKMLTQHVVRPLSVVMESGLSDDTGRRGY